MIKVNPLDFGSVELTLPRAAVVLCPHTARRLAAMLVAAADKLSCTEPHDDSTAPLTPKHPYLTWFEAPEGINVDDLHAVLSEVIKTRFGLAPQRATLTFWRVEAPFYGSTDVSLGHSRVLVFPDTLAWSQYLAWYVREALAKHYGGRCHQEGVEESWEPDPDRYPTFESFLSRVGPLDEAQLAYIQSLPEALR